MALKGERGMFVVVLIGVLAGATLGACHYRVFALIPVILLIALCAVTTGLLSHLEGYTIAFGTLIAFASPQIGYIGSTIALRLVAAQLEKRAAERKLDLLLVIQARIGTELSTVFEVPRELPRPMVALIARIDRE
jgi:hypothetical protein